MKDEAVDKMTRYLKDIRHEMKELKKGLASAAKPFYTNQEAMELFGVCSPTLKKWRDSGLLGYSQFDNTYFYSKEDIEAFLSSIHFKAYAAQHQPMH